MAVISEDCRSCGRCAGICPQGAIEVTIKNYKYIEDAVASINPLVDVTWSFITLVFPPAAEEADQKEASIQEENKKLRKELEKLKKQIAESTSEVSEQNESN